MPKRNKFIVKKFDGDDQYSYAVFRAEDVRGHDHVIFYGEARPIDCGLSKNEACALRNRLNEKT